MNNSPVTTGAVAVTAGMIASIIAWLAGLAHLNMPAEVSGAIAAIVLYGAHVVGQRMAPKQTVVSSAIPVVHPTEGLADK